MATELIRIVFELAPGDWHGNATERLWAEPLGGGRFVLRNSPFFAFDVSNEDVVFGEDREGQVLFAGVASRGGHSTYRLILRHSELSDPGFVSAWSPLQALGCSYEQGRVLAVDIPAAADIYSVYELLEAGRTSGVWDFEEGHCGHTLRPASAPGPNS